MDYFGEEERQVVQGHARLTEWTLTCVVGKWTELNSAGLTSRLISSV